MQINSVVYSPPTKFSGKNQNFPLFCDANKGERRSTVEMTPAQSPDRRRRFAVLKTGHATEYTERTYGGYGSMLERLLRDGDNEEWDIFSVIDGDFSFQEKGDDHLIQSYSGFVITGSSADAHAEDVPWILRLCELLRSLYHNKKKLLGICFGHQILARALGGETGRAAVGWELGVKSLQIDTEAVSKLYGVQLASPLNAIESHRDQVSRAPPGSVILASSAKTNVEMFSVGDHVLGIQCHPEFSKDVMLDIIQQRLATNSISVEVANEAIQSFEQDELGQAELKVLCKAFLKENLRDS
ncbi:gamma-glutamyl peptidase 3-like [Aristolochia californica]|uniref:gamma-glutamyl peptidase 3-like n=1 Tax=Aristolochia californica TaxID=171875 RepID=UPI0035D55053